MQFRSSSFDSAVGLSASSVLFASVHPDRSTCVLFAHESLDILFVERDIFESMLPFFFPTLIFICKPTSWTLTTGRCAQRRSPLKSFDGAERDASSFRDVLDIIIVVAISPQT